jgi:teichoic acid transport system ATP-binding protein
LDQKAEGKQEVQKLAIRVQKLDKAYKLYDKPSDRLKEAFGIRKGLHRVHFALRDVNLTIQKGETVGIIGTNGSGKSTLLKIITGVLNQSAGEVSVEGRISALLELGAGFNMEYSGMENIYLNGTTMGFSDQEIKSKLPDILDFADIGEYIYQPVKTYSSGMFVRLAFAVAINIDPEILIVDEALSVGDVFFQAKCYHKFDEFKKLGKTIVFVSHDLSSISKYCDRVFLLNKGKLLGHGTAKEMIDAYKRVLVGQYETKHTDPEGNALSESADIEDRFNAITGTETGTSVNQSDHTKMLEYGTLQAKIIDAVILDDRGVPTHAVIKGSEFRIVMKVQFFETLPAPIFAYSFKTPLGIEVTGTNTMFEKAYLEEGKEGSCKEITFTQKMRLQGGEYLLSLGVTGYRKDTFEVYHRLYDFYSVQVISDKDTVGYFDPETSAVVVELSS